MENLRKKPYTTQAEIDAMKKELENACRGKENSKPANFGAKKIAGTAIFVFILLMLCAILVNIWMDKAAGREASVFGFRIYNVETGSMEPTLPVGCYIVSKIPSDSTALQVGDIVTFQAEDMVVTHRIIEVIERVIQDVYKRQLL